MKKFVLMVAAQVVSATTAMVFAQEAPVVKVAEPVKLEKGLFGGLTQVATPILGPLDGNYFTDSGTSIITLTPGYIETDRMDAPREGKFKSGSTSILNGDRVYNFYGHYAKKVTHLMAFVYDVKQKKQIVGKEFHDSHVLLRLTGKSNWNFIPVSTGGAYDVRFSKNGKFIGVVTYENRPAGRCFNLALYDRDFNEIGKKECLDTTLVRVYEKEAFWASLEGYCFDFNVDDEGVLRFVRSQFTYFHPNAEGSALAVYTLSADGFKEYQYGKALERNDLHAIKILSAGPDKVVVTGIYSDVSRFNGKYPTYLYNGIGVVSLPLTEGGTVEKRSWQKLDFLFGGAEQKPMSSPSLIPINTATWDIPEGMAYAFNQRLAVINSDGTIGPIYKLPESAFENYSYRIIYKGRMYWITLKGSDDVLYGIGADGKVTRTPVPAFYQPLVPVRAIERGDGVYDFVQCDAKYCRKLTLTLP